MAWPPADGKPYMPANGTEGEMFFESWCAYCAHDDEENDDEENEEYCDILSNSFFGTQPKEWTWRGGCGHCSAYITFIPGAPKPEPRCPLTMELFA